MPPKRKPMPPGTQCPLCGTATAGSERRILWGTRHQWLDNGTERWICRGCHVLVFEYPDKPTAKLPSQAVFSGGKRERLVNPWDMPLAQWYSVPY